MPNDVGYDAGTNGEVEIAAQATPAKPTDLEAALPPPTPEQALVRRAMRELALSRTLFAQRLDVDPQTVWRWLKGSSVPRATQIDKIRELLGHQERFADSFQGENAVRSAQHVLQQELDATEIWIVKANHHLKSAEFPEVRDDMYRNIASRIVEHRTASDDAGKGPLDVYFVTTNQNSANSLHSEIESALRNRDLFRKDLSLAKVLNVLQQTIFPDVAFKDADRFISEFEGSAISKEFNVTFDEFKKRVHIYALSDIWEFISLSMIGLFGTSFVYVLYNEGYAEKHSKRFDVFIENDMYKYVACPNPEKAPDSQTYWIELPSENARMHVQSVRPMLEHVRTRVQAAEAEAEAAMQRSAAM